MHFSLCKSVNIKFMRVYPSIIFSDKYDPSYYSDNANIGLFFFINAGATAQMDIAGDAAARALILKLNGAPISVYEFMYNYFVNHFRK